MNTNDATRATAEALPDPSDMLRRKIATHTAAYSYFDSVVYLSDSGILGRQPTESEMLRWKEASDIEEWALDEVCSHEPASLAEVSAKARHLQKHHNYRRENLTDDQVALLLGSMVAEGGEA